MWTSPSAKTEIDMDEIRASEAPNHSGPEDEVPAGVSYKRVPSGNDRELQG